MYLQSPKSNHLWKPARRCIQGVPDEMYPSGTFFQLVGSVSCSHRVFVFIGLSISSPHTTMIFDRVSCIVASHGNLLGKMSSCANLVYLA